MTLDQARDHIGSAVVYLPTTEEGVITSVNGRFVFVRFNVKAVNGTACDPTDLLPLGWGDSR